jgi:hypothetical protein
MPYFDIDETSEEDKEESDEDILNHDIIWNMS